MPDVSIGIPAMLLCIEMAIFSILHLWAYPWKPYDIHRSQIVAAEGGSSFQLDGRAAYKGGPFGIRAFMDAFNPIDIIKAVGRAFRWLFVGRKHREQDVSYKSHLQESVNPDGSAVLGTSKPGKYQPLNDDDSDINVPHNANPYPQYPLNPQSQTQNTQNQKSFSKPFSLPGETDIGAVSTSDRTNDGFDDMRAVHPMPMPDTSYYGARPTANPP